MSIAKLASRLAFMALCAACTAAPPPSRRGATVTPPVATIAIPPGARGVVVPPNGGDRLEYCVRPLTLWIKVDSVTAPTTQMVAGVGQIRGDEGIGRHRGRHEIVYIRSGWGLAVFGSDTTPLGPGSTMYVPPGWPHRLVSTSAEPMEYFWVIAPLGSAQGFRDAASIGCPGGPPAPPAATAPLVMPDTGTRPVIIPPTDGERIAYCDIPLVITAKVDETNARGTGLRAAAGVLRRGSEEGVHTVDEVVLITHGRGKAFVGKDTVAVEPGSVTHAPRGMTHGFINEGTETLEYFIVYAGGGSREGFRRRASRPGSYCPDRLPPPALNR